MMENVFTATKISSNPSSEILHSEKSIQNTINSFLGGKVLVFFHTNLTGGYIEKKILNYFFGVRIFF